MNTMFYNARHGWLAAAASTLLLAACGGGGGGEDGGSYFAIQGVLSTGGPPLTVCIEGAEAVDPASAAGQRVGAALAEFYGIGSYLLHSGTGQGCRERFNRVDVLLSPAEYNNRVVPAVSGGEAPPPPPPGGGTPPPPGGGSPPPPEPITPRACSPGGGAGTGGLQLYGESSYSGLDGAADASGSFLFDPGEIGFQDANQGPAATTGSLRAQLWAVAGNYAGGDISGYVVGSYAIRFSGGGNQLRNGESANLLPLQLASRTPPRGSYCMAVTFEEYAPARCSAADGYCIVDWLQYGSPAEFR